MVSTEFYATFGLVSTFKIHFQMRLKIFSSNLENIYEIFFLSFMTMLMFRIELQIWINRDT